MFDPKTTWLLAKTSFQVLALLVKSAALIGAIYFAIFTVSFFEPFFTTTNHSTLAREAKLVYICCFVVIAFLALLIGEQLARLVFSLFPGQCWSCKPEAAWSRILTIVVIGFLLSAAWFGTLYPLLKALAWRSVFAAAGRADLQEQATALSVFMGITLAVGMMSLLRLSWVLVAQCWGASGLWCRKRKEKGKEFPLGEVSGRRFDHIV